MNTHSLPCITTIGSIEIAIAPIEYVPDKIDAIVEEQDTNLLLTADTEINYPEDDYDSLIKQMSAVSTRKPGQIIIKQETPLRLQAIVHNIYNEPSWKSEWITNVLKQLRDIIEEHEIKILAMPLLGTYHGKMDELESVKLHYFNLASYNSTILQKIWLIAPDPACQRIKDNINGMK